MPWFALILLAATIQSPVDEAGIKGGLVVPLGCGDGKLTAALPVNITDTGMVLAGRVTA